MSSTPLINASPRESLGCLEESNEGLEGDDPIPSTSYSVAIGSLPQETVKIESDIEVTDVSDFDSLSEEELQQRISANPDILGEQDEFNELSNHEEEEAQTKRNGKCKSTTNVQNTKSSKKKLNVIDRFVEELKEERLMSAELQRKMTTSLFYEVLSLLCL